MYSTIQNFIQLGRARNVITCRRPRVDSEKPKSQVGKFNLHWFDYRIPNLHIHNSDLRIGRHECYIRVKWCLVDDSLLYFYFRVTVEAP